MLDFVITSKMATYDIERGIWHVFVSADCPCGGKENFDLMIDDPDDDSALMALFMKHLEEDVERGLLNE